MRTNAALLWASNGGKFVSDSSAHSETAELSRGVKSTTYVRMVSDEIGRPVMGPTSVLGDNKATNELIVKEGSSSKSRHFERATILAKWAVQQLIVVCKLIGTSFMVADIFTKATDEETFRKMRSVMRNTPDETIDERTMRIGRWVMNASRR